MDERMTRQEHLDWAKKRALEYCDRGELQRALDSLISDLGEHPETDHFFCSESLIVKWMEGKLDTPKKMRELIDSVQ
jgi:hypothetical protein